MQINDIGVAITVEVQDANGAAVDITGASAITFYLRSPSQVLTTHPGVVGNGPQGIFSWTTTTTNDLNEAGQWEVQVGYTLGIFQGRTTVGRLTVNANLV